jgi:hypothetical protein
MSSPFLSLKRSVWGAAAVRTCAVFSTTTVKARLQDCLRRGDNGPKDSRRPATCPARGPVQQGPTIAQPRALLLPHKKNRCSRCRTCGPRPVRRIAWLPSLSRHRCRSDAARAPRAPEGRRSAMLVSDSNAAVTHMRDLILNASWWNRGHERAPARRAHEAAAMPGCPSRRRRHAARGSPRQLLAR